MLKPKITELLKIKRKPVRRDGLHSDLSWALDTH